MRSSCDYWKTQAQWYRSVGLEGLARMCAEYAETAAQVEARRDTASKQPQPKKQGESHE
ncbi:MAG: hypothetical protein FOGNACKC_00826 [Anaerolineae bacterium]|nr:hypothetical protein [Anaerolineae bacterium]